ncbi:hypothetical protein Q31b_34130 [Novipirellula aureliae]|uniref:Uncharacterized protein n=1 Tax=Novipirellula aureliae TaxID=2527966 RepID=A0A5C6DYU0_9BACT|nr:DUF5698 domain-containing protein [Novipirellula aureliae]TWU40069.1 hypothetical protein Q31b_34130 [Novipirellula aureliae]
MLTLLLSSILIFALRVTDVSLGALRISMLVRGRRGLAGLFGFVESFMWLIAAALVLGNLDSPVKFLAYSGGYACGTMLGSTLERWHAVGDSIVRVVTPTSAPSVAPTLREAGYYVTTVDAEGRDGPVSVSLSVVPRRRVHQMLQRIHQISPKSFVTHEETTPIRLPITPAVSVRK